MRREMRWCMAMLLALGLGWAGCGPLYPAMEGMSKMMPEDTVVKCPYCLKKIDRHDRQCPHCGKHVEFDIGEETMQREIQEVEREPGS